MKVVSKVVFVGFCFVFEIPAKQFFVRMRSSWFYVADTEEIMPFSNTHEREIQRVYDAVGNVYRSHRFCNYNHTIITLSFSQTRQPVRLPRSFKMTAQWS